MKIVKIELDKNLLKIGYNVFFDGEKLPYKVMALNDKFIVCTRSLNRRQDADLLHHKVDMQAYMSFTAAYNDLKDEPIYTIIDIENHVRSSHNKIFNPYKLRFLNGAKNLLRDLTSGETELSRRNLVHFRINNEKTLRINRKLL